ncbi:DUF6519 domain-containing protein [Streptomyces sp. NPDC090077]|uniref:DUF6519 domain-containing protein n=1 Tax=Streptomyces sp. NPDC090077 TaxID=3365938 RepID=UPI0038227317
MSVDISRVSFDPLKHYSRIVHQQGRVTLDADANEQTAVLLHYLRTVVADVLGPAAAPLGAPGFTVTRIARDPDRDLAIGAGRLYVDGVLVENDAPTTYLTQPEGYVDPETAPVPEGPALAYLRAWERDITVIQDPAIREIALGGHGPDTAARAKVVWQVALHAFGEQEDPGGAEATVWFRSWLDGLYAPRGLLAARALHEPEAPADACVTAPRARFRGPENQLYRVQIHTSGVGAFPGDDGRRVVRPRRRGAGRDLRPEAPQATFVWSRENASVALPVASVAGPVVTLASWGRDHRLGVDVGDLVELVDDATAVHAADEVPGTPPQRVHRVVAVDVPGRTVTLDADPGAGPPGGRPPLGVGGDPELHPYLRRWDHRPQGGAGALPVVLDTWIALEDGVEVRFGVPQDCGPAREGSGERAPGRFRRGDHWLVPARTVPGDVVWPQDEEGPAAVAPHGVVYHYAPLAYLPGGAGDPVPLVARFAPLPPAAG